MFSEYSTGQKYVTTVSRDASRFSRDESREKRDSSRFKRDESRFLRVHWKYQYFTFVDIQTCFVYYHNDLRGRHDFHSHQRYVCTMCVL